MNVSVIVPCFNEEKNILNCLESLVQQKYSLGQFEIIVVDGNSRDNTQEVVKKFSQRFEFIRLIVESKKGVAAGRNSGIKTAEYDYVGFIDADCAAPNNWLQILAEKYQTIRQQDSMVIAVGGANVPPSDADSFLQAIGIALDSYVGSFNSPQGRRFDIQKYVPSLSTLNVLYEKQKLIEVGCFDESLFSEAEDADLNYRLYCRGHRFVFVPNSLVIHKMRPTPRTWLINMFRYGKGRARLLKRHPTMWTPAFLLPPLFLASIFILFFSHYSKLFLLPVLYIPFLLGLSIFQCFSKGYPQLIAHVVLVYLILHFGYAAGETYGLINPKIK